MAYLNGIVNPKNADGNIKAIYDQIESKYGFIPNSIKLQSIDQFYLKQYHELSIHFSTHTCLSDKFRLISNYIISHKDKCEYCINLLGSFLQKNFGFSEQYIKDIVQDPNNADLDEKEKELLIFVLKILDDANSSSKDDIKHLRSLGYTDIDIFDAVNFATQMRKYHTVFSVFGVEREEI